MEACRRVSSDDYTGERRRTATPVSSIDLGLGGTGLLQVDMGNARYRYMSLGQVHG
jgi:hypothetical protein